MQRSLVGPEIERLIQLLARLPGLGPRSARRAVLQLLKKREEFFVPLCDAMRLVSDRVMTCSACGNVDTIDPCTICTDKKRDQSLLIVVETVGDLWAIERVSAIRAIYHVLGGTLSPFDGVGPEDLALDKLLERVKTGSIKEIILALNANVEGQTTAHYITDFLSETNVKITKLAHGVPVGGELDYLDEGTLSAALLSRTSV